MEKPASAKGSNRISRRVLGLWEQLVGEALRAQEARESLEIGSSRRRDYGSSSYTVPQFLQDQTNIESVLQAASDIEPENIQVAQILYAYAFTLVHQLDPMSEGRDVLQLKTGLSSMISKKRMQREGQKLDRTDDIQVISDYYKKYRERLDIANLEEEERQRQQESTSSGGAPESYDGSSLSYSSFSLFVVSPPVHLFSLRLQFIVVVGAWHFLLDPQISEHNVLLVSAFS
jgi:hypothetical protein